MTVTLVLSTLVSGVLVALVARALARRMLGAPVGSVRSFVVGLAIFAAASPAANAVAVPAGLIDPETQQPVVGLGIIAFLVLLAFGWAFALGVSVLVLAEMLVPTGSVPGPITWLRDQLARRRRTRRYLQVVMIFARHGLRSVLRQDPRRTSPTEAGAALVGALNASGVTFVKLGQVISTRGDLVPPALAAELAQLQTAASPEPWEAIDAVVTAELGERRSALAIETEPLAAASVAQVHLATLPQRDGELVVVKVQRPQARESVRVDVDIVRRLGVRLERSAPWAREMRVAALADGFGDALLEELDYGLEVANTRRLAAAVGEKIDVPRIHADLSTGRVIVMEHIDGVTLGRAGDRLAKLEAEAPGTRDALARTLLTSVLRQVLVEGVFHADLHPGNVVLRGSGRLALLDLGSVGILDRQLREILLGLLAAFDAQDNEAAATLLLQLVPPSDIDGYALRRDLGAAMTVMAGPGGLGPAGVARLFDVFRRHQLALPPHVAAALRTFASLQGCLEILAPDADLVTLVRECTKVVAGDVVSPERLRATATSRGLATLAVAGRLPGQLDAVVTQIASGELAASRRLRTELGTWAERALGDVIGALVAGVLVIAAVMLLGVDGGPMMTSTVPWTWYLSACVGLVGFGLVLRVLFRQVARR